MIKPFNSIEKDVLSFAGYSDVGNGIYSRKNNGKESCIMIGSNYPFMYSVFRDNSVARVPTFNGITSIVASETEWLMA